MKKWEYLRIDNGWGKTDTFDNLGRQGWELVGFSDDGTFIFKRPLHDRL